MENKQDMIHMLQANKETLKNKVVDRETGWEERIQLYSEIQSINLQIEELQKH